MKRHANFCGWIEQRIEVRAAPLDTITFLPLQKEKAGKCYCRVRNDFFVSGEARKGFSFHTHLLLSAPLLRPPGSGERLHGRGVGGGDGGPLGGGRGLQARQGAADGGGQGVVVRATAAARRRLRSGAVALLAVCIRLQVVVLSSKDAAYHRVELEEKNVKN